MPTINYIAELKLDFVVVGGGISGLAVAFILCRGGHRVRVLERLPNLSVYAGGVRVPPNLSKLFKEWIGAKELAKLSTLNVGTPWHDLVTGQPLGYHPWKQVIMQETGGDFLMMAHEDVHRMLYKLATSAGALVEFGVEVSDVRGTKNKPRVTLASGEVIEPDMVVGADGATSLVRQTAFDLDDEPVPTGITVMGGLAPASKMLKDPLLAQYIQKDEWPIFMGPYRSLCCHPVRASKDFAVQLYWPDEDAGTANTNLQESWYDTIPTSDIDFSSYGQNIQHLMKLVPQLSRTRHMKHSHEPEEWNDESGRIVLVGEAAHPWFPGGSHTTSMVVEDAVVLGTLFSHLETMDQIPKFLSAYQEIREERCKAVREEDVSNAALMRLPPGPDRDRRNETMGRPASDDQADLGVLKRELDTFSAIFCYEAADAAEEWWVDFGRWQENPRPSHKSIDFTFGAAVAVTTTTHDSNEETIV